MGHSINRTSVGHRERTAPLQMSVKVMGVIADVHKGDIDLLSLQVSVACKGLGAKLVLHYSTVLAEPRAAALVN